MNQFVEDNVVTSNLFLDSASLEDHRVKEPRFIKVKVNVLICLITGVIAFSSISIDPFQTVLLEYMNLSDVQYNSISSFYSIPNIIFVVFAGKLVDKIGRRLALIISASICLFGQISIFLGIFLNIFSLLLVGSFIFGIGAEAAFVSSATYQVFWFTDSWLNFYMGIQHSFCRFMSFVCMRFSMKIFNFMFDKYPSLPRLKVASFVIGIGSLLCLVIVLLSCLLSKIDYSYVKFRRIYRQHSALSNDLRIRRTSKFSVTFWVLCVFCMIFHIPASSFESISSLYYQLKYDYRVVEANSALSLYSFYGIFFCLIFGFITSRTGGEIIWMVTGSAICLASHALFSFTFIRPNLFLVFRCFGSSIVSCSFWISVKYVVSKSNIGLAYGLVQSFENLGLAFGPYAIAFLLKRYGYFVLELFIQYCFSFSLATCIAIAVVDKRYTAGVLLVRTKNKRLSVMDEEISF